MVKILGQTPPPNAINVKEILNLFKEMNESLKEIKETLKRMEIQEVKLTIKEQMEREGIEL